MADYKKAKQSNKDSSETKLERKLGKRKTMKTVTQL